MFTEFSLENLSDSQEIDQNEILSNQYPESSIKFNEIQESFNQKQNTNNYEIQENQNKENEKQTPDFFQNNTNSNSIEIFENFSNLLKNALERNQMQIQSLVNSFPFLQNQQKDNNINNNNNNNKEMQYEQLSFITPKTSSQTISNISRNNIDTDIISSDAFISEDTKKHYQYNKTNKNNTNNTNNIHQYQKDSINSENEELQQSQKNQNISKQFSDFNMQQTDNLELLKDDIFEDFSGLPIINEEQEPDDDIFQPLITKNQQKPKKNLKKFKFENLIPLQNKSKKIFKIKNYQNQQNEKDYQTKNCIKGIQLKVIKFQKSLLKQNSKLNTPDYLSYTLNFGKKCTNTYDLQAFYQNYPIFTQKNLTSRSQMASQALKIIKSYNKVSKLEQKTLWKNLEEFNMEIGKINSYNFYNRAILKLFLQFGFSNIVYTSKKILEKESYNMYALLLQNTKLQDTDLMVNVKQ